MQKKIESGSKSRRRACAPQSAGERLLLGLGDDGGGQVIDVQGLQLRERPRHVLYRPHRSRMTPSLRFSVREVVRTP